MDEHKKRKFAVGSDNEDEENAEQVENAEGATKPNNGVVDSDDDDMLPNEGGNK